MKNSLIDGLMFLLFFVVMGAVILMSNLWTDKSLIYHLIYEGI